MFLHVICVLPQQQPHYSCVYLALLVRVPILVSLSMTSSWSYLTWHCIMPPVYAAVKVWQHQFGCACRQQSKEFHQVLQACTIPTQHHVYDDRSHAGFVIDWTGPPLDSQVQNKPFFKHPLCMSIHVRACCHACRHASHDMRVLRRWVSCAMQIYMVHDTSRDQQLVLLSAYDVAVSRVLLPFACMVDARQHTALDMIRTGQAG